MSKWFMRGGLVVAPLVMAWPLCPESQQEPAKHEHVPHQDHRPAPTRAIIELVTSASSSAHVPFIPYDSSAADVVIRANHDRRVSQTMRAIIASSSPFKIE